MQYPLDALKPWLREFVKVEWRKDDKELRLLRQVVDTVFFASLGKEDPASVHVRVVYHPDGIEHLRGLSDYNHVGGGYYRSRAWEVMQIAENGDVTEFGAHSLVKISPLANISRGAVVVGSPHGHLAIQGLARRVKSDEYTVDRNEAALVIHAPEPGHIVIYNKGEEIFRYEAGTRIQRRRFQLRHLLSGKESVVRLALERMNAQLLQQVRTSRFASDRMPYITDVVHGLVEKMVSTRHGGLIAMLPCGGLFSEGGAAGKYRLAPEDGSLLARTLTNYLGTRRELENLAWRAGANQRDAVDAEAANVDLDAAIAENEERLAEEAFEAAIDSIGQLTIVDNALLIGPDLQVICAGYPIPIPPPDRLRAIHEALTVRGDLGAEYDINQHGSRHRAAEAFARQNPGGLAFVASQDGPLRCFARLESSSDVVLVWRIQLPTD